MAKKITYYTATILLTLLMLMSAGMYFLNHEGVVAIFETLGFPGWMVYPLAIAKLLGLLAIWTRKVKTLTEWAYAGFFFGTGLALSAHLIADDGGFVLSGIGLGLVLLSYFSRPEDQGEA